MLTLEMCIFMPRTVGQSQTIDVYEVPSATIEQRRLVKGTKWTDFASARSPFSFSGIDLAIAVTKADVLNGSNPLRYGLAFLLESAEIVDWGRGTFTLLPGGADRFNDFVARAFAGRIGQGLAILYAEKMWRLSFVGHLRSLLLRQGVPLVDAKAKALPVADFIFESSLGTRSILEAKGSFWVNGYSPTEVKSSLKSALKKQVNPWMSKVTPTAANGYVTLSCIREAPSLSGPSTGLVFTDPDGDEPVAHYEISSDLLRRTMYAGWLRVMGLRDPANRLLSPGGLELASTYEFAVIGVQGREIAFPLWTSFTLLPTRFVSFGSYVPDHVPFAYGMDREVLQLLAERIRGNSGALVRMPEIGQPTANEESATFSLWSDGTWLGSLENLQESVVRLESLSL